MGSLKMRNEFLGKYIYGGVKVSTGILKQSKRAEAHNFLKMCNLKLNANNNKLAVAA